MQCSNYHCLFYEVPISNISKPNTEKLENQLLPCGSDSKGSTCNAGDLGSNPESGRSPGEGTGNPLQHSCLGNPMDRGAWQLTVHEVENNQKRLSKDR